MGRDRKLIFNKYLYFISLLIPLFLTLFYGENLTVNIGGFTSYGNFGFGMDPLFIFGWPFLVLIYKFLEYFCNKFKQKNLLTIITIILILVLLVINFNGGKELIDFALTCYKI